MIEVLRVSSRSNPNAVAGALAGVVRATGSVEMQVVGAGALNQAVKAVAIARGYLAPSGVDLVCVPTFADVSIDGERRTGIRLLCQDRGGAPAVGPTVDLRVVEAAEEPEMAVAMRVAPSDSLARDRMPVGAAPGALGRAVEADDQVQLEGRGL